MTAWKNKGGLRGLSVSIRGFTLPEMAIAAGISSMVMIGVLAVQFLSARTIKEIYGPTRSRGERIHALNVIRMKLVDAQIGSCVIESGNFGIRFASPVLGGVTSRFFFDATDRILYYDDDISTDPPRWAVADGPINVTFTLGCRDLSPPNFTDYLGADSLVTVYVQTSADLAYSRVDKRDGETVVYLRNP